MRIGMRRWLCSFGPWANRAGERRCRCCRIGGEHVYRQRENLDYTVPEGFAGSILNLQPGRNMSADFN